MIVVAFVHIVRKFADIIDDIWSSFKWLDESLL